MFYVKNYTPTPRLPFESFIRDAEKLLNDPFSKEQASKYPLTNIGYCGMNLVFEIALAGFKKENISIGYVGNVITVNAKWNNTTQTTENTQTECPCNDNEIKYIQKNISTKDVCRKFYLANEYLGGSVKWKYLNGLLTVAVYPNTDNNNVEPSDDNEEFFTQNNCECTCCNTQNVTEE